MKVQNLSMTQLFTSDRCEHEALSGLHRSIIAMLFLVTFTIFGSTSVVADSGLDVQNRSSEPSSLEEAATSCEYPNASASENSRTAQSGQLIIRKGGLYQGTWFSPDAKTPAVLVITSEPVEITNSLLSGYGDLIVAQSSGRLRVDNTKGYGTGSRPGKFALLTGGGQFVIENNQIQHLWGIKVIGNGAGMPSGSVSITKNVGCDITDGLESQAHFVQIAEGVFTDSKIHDNGVINRPGSSHVEDVISLYNAGGTSNSRFKVYHNFIDGAYALNPLTDAFSGGGIISDGEPHNGPSSVSSYVDITDNCISSTTNYGIAIASGHDISVRGNLIVSSGLTDTGQHIKAQNVGLYVWDIAKSGVIAFFNDSAEDNIIAWRKPALSGGEHATLNNAWFPDCYRGAGTCSFNSAASVSLSDAQAQRIQRNFRVLWPSCEVALKRARSLLAPYELR